MRKAFTLIEVLIVVVLLAILATIVIQLLYNMADQAANSKEAADLDVLNSASQIYRIETGAFPADAAALTASGVQAVIDTDGDGDVDGDDTCGPWIDEEPLDPDTNPPSSYFGPDALGRFSSAD